MFAIRSKPSLALPLALLLALFGARPAAAQGVSSGEDPSEVGATDGRRLGLSQGRSLGRAQSFYGAFHEGFRESLFAGLARGRDGALAARLFEDGRSLGEEQGRRAGGEAGAAAALAGWLSAANPSQPSEVEIPAPPEESVPELCRPSAPLRLPLVRELTVEVDPDGLETRESPVVVDAFDLAYPSEDDLRNRARAAGATSEAVGFWVRDYKTAFQSAWFESFDDERAGTPVGDQSEWRGHGREAGAKEAERRIACEIGEARWREGFAAGWAKAFRGAHAEGWAATNERHGKRAVVVVQSPRLVDASGDGLLEPGEGLRLVGVLVNAGSAAAQRSAGSWEALRGMEGQGFFDGGLAAGESRALDLDLGSVDAEAPPGTSVVLRVRGLGSDPIVLDERLGRPARIESSEASLGLEGGRLVARIEATIQSASAASARAEIDLVGDGASIPVGRLRDGESKRVRLVVPTALPATLESLVTGVLVLRTSEGLPWHAARWAAPLDLPTAVALAAQDDAPPALAALLVDHLARAWQAALAEGGRDGLPGALRAYAAAMTGLPDGARHRLERSVTAPLLERLEGADGGKRLKKQVRELLAG